MSHLFNIYKDKYKISTVPTDLLPQTQTILIFSLSKVFTPSTVHTPPFMVKFAFLSFFIYHKKDEMDIAKTFDCDPNSFFPKNIHAYKI